MTGVLSGRDMADTAKSNSTTGLCHAFHDSFSVTGQLSTDRLQWIFPTLGLNSNTVTHSSGDPSHVSLNLPSLGLVWTSFHCKLRTFHVVRLVQEMLLLQP
jgi:hypothetical protein